MRLVQGATTLKQKIVGITEIVDPDYAPWDGTVTDVKPMISVNLGTPFEGDNDIVKLSPLKYGISLSDTEAAALAQGDVVMAWVPADTGRLESTGFMPALTFEAEVTGEGVTVAALRDDAIDLIANITNGADTLTLVNSASTNVDIDVTRAARQAIATTAPSA